MQVGAETRERVSSVLPARFVHAWAPLSNVASGPAGRGRAVLTCLRRAARAAGWRTSFECAGGRECETQGSETLEGRRAGGASCLGGRRKVKASARVQASA